MNDPNADKKFQMKDRVKVGLTLLKLLSPQMRGSMGNIRSDPAKLYEALHVTGVPEDTMIAILEDVGLLAAEALEKTEENCRF